MTTDKTPAALVDERARFEAWCLDRKWSIERSAGFASYYKDDAVLGAWEAWQYIAALSVQPSLAGQGDALQLASEWRHVFEGDTHDMAGANKNTMRRFIQAINALAARQPVGKPVLWVSPEVLDAMAIHRAQDFPAGGMGLACPAGSATVPLYLAPPAQAVDLDAARREGHDCAIRYVLGYLNGTGDLASTQYGEILNGCGRESIIRSAIRDGELEFTGLGRWVAKYGTDAERALIDSQAVGNG